jgi:hypothetical protein
MVTTTHNAASMPLGQLIAECKVVQSRVAAILRCDAAVSHLASEDVFGSNYEALLRADHESLRDAIRMGEAELGEFVEVDNP